MKKKIYVLPMVLVLLLTACSGKDANPESIPDKQEVNSEKSDMKENTADVIPTQAMLEEDTTADNTVNEDTANETINTAEVTAAAKVTEAAAETKIAFTAVDKIPAEYLKARTDSCGSIQPISYTTYDYFGDSSAAITKNAYVYLPYNYDESKQYNV